MYYVYILYSKTSDLYYVGYSDNPEGRLIEHNTKPLNTFTSKHRPWIINLELYTNNRKSGLS